jgi:hypothetical protein
MRNPTLRSLEQCIGRGTSIALRQPSARNRWEFAPIFLFSGGLMKFSLRNTSLVVIPSVQKSTQQPADQSPNWALSYQATCAANIDQTACPGAYGFTVNADGSYQVGPGPQGQTTTGKLAADDFESITSLTGGVIANTTSVARAETCGGDFSVDADYTLTLSKRNLKKTVILHKKGADLCSNRFESETAQSLHTAFVAVVEKYYATPFPNACLEAAQAVSTLYPALEGCKVDADCGYLDQNYNVIATDGEATVFVDNCSVVKNLPAANAEKARENTAALQAALAKAQNACGYGIVRDGCAGTQSFASTAAPAICRQGTCRVNPTLGF